jgi:curved DNA-binding protein CbpA
LKDYYAILGLGRGASTREIKRAYKKLVRKWHPDLHPDDPTCRTGIQEINEAYAVLSDPEKRASYDRQIEERRIFETKRMGFHPDPHEHPFFFYFTRMNEVLRKRTQK